METDCGHKLTNERLNMYIYMIDTTVLFQWYGTFVACVRSIRVHFLQTKHPWNNRRPCPALFKNEHPVIVSSFESNDRYIKEKTNDVLHALCCYAYSMLYVLFMLLEQTNGT